MILKTIDELLESEAIRGLQDSSKKDLKRFLGTFGKYCTEKEASLKSLTPEFFITYMLDEHEDKNFSNKKAHVWALRKFGSYLNFTGL